MKSEEKTNEQKEAFSSPKYKSVREFSKNHHVVISWSLKCHGRCFRKSLRAELVLRDLYASSNGESAHMCDWAEAGRRSENADRQTNRPTVGPTDRRSNTVECRVTCTLPKKGQESISMTKLVYNYS